MPQAAGARTFCGRCFTLWPHTRAYLSCLAVVLFSRLTQYRAYPPLIVGWSLKLVDVKTASVVWAVDEVFDASNESVNNAARRYLLQQLPETSTPMDSRSILNSPRRFGHFSANQVMATLPDRKSLLTKVPPQPADKQTEMRKQ